MSASDLDEDQTVMLRKIFDSFDPAGKGSISTGTVGTIFTIMGLKVTDKALKRIIEEVDADGSGELEFDEFCTLAAQFLIEEDMEQMEKELTEAFRLFDKEGPGEKCEKKTNSTTRITTNRCFDG